MSSNKESNMEQAKVTDAIKGDDKDLQPDSTTHTEKDENNSNDIDPIMKMSNMMNVIMNEITCMKQNISSLNLIYNKINSQEKSTTLMYHALQASIEESKKQNIRSTDQYTKLHSEYSKQVIKLDNNFKKLLNDIEIKFSDFDEKFKKLAEDNRSNFSVVYQIMEENKKELNAKILEIKKHDSSNEEINNLTEEVRKLKDFNDPVKRILYGVKDLIVNNLPTNDE